MYSEVFVVTPDNGYLKIFKQPMVKSICTQVTQYPGKHSASVFLKHIFRQFFSLGLSNHHRRGQQSADYDIFWVKMFSWQGEWGAIFRGRVRGLCLLLPPRFCRERWSETQCLYQYELCPAPALTAGQHYIHSTFYAGVKIGRGVFIKYGFVAIFSADIVQAMKIKFLL